MNKVKPEECIAIDFGTSNTAVFTYVNRKVLNPVETVDTNYCIPSVAMIDRKSIIIPDKLVNTQASKGYIYSVKRILGMKEYSIVRSISMIPKILILKYHMDLEKARKLERYIPLKWQQRFSRNAKMWLKKR